MDKLKSEVETIEDIKFKDRSRELTHFGQERKQTSKYEQHLRLTLAEKLIFILSEL